MARNVSDEELQLKKRARRRLVGAIVLVTTVAVVLPMVLDSEPKPVNQNINIQIPSPDAGVLSSAPKPLKPADAVVAPLQSETKADAVAESKENATPRTEAAPVIKPEVKSEAKPEAKPEPKAETKPVETKAAEPKVEVKTEARAEDKPVAKPEPKTATAKTEPAAKSKEAVKEKPKASAGGFVIQVAALSDMAKAKELQAKIAGGGMKAYTEVVQTSKGPVTRVRVGPYNSREAAEKARTQLQKLQLDGKVVPR
jgi:DedD protein